ncbi:TPA: hydroxypyruvate isomerase [Candidatus Poribacteria bacterium]|nr:hydroxypyruvate isomerase [Candidatus Poribacteria bacterium]
MIKLSPCIEALYNKLPFIERIEKVANVGLKAFEFWGWGNKDIDAIKSAKDKFGLEVSIFGADSGGPLVDPANRGKIADGMKRSAEVAHKLGCKRLIITVGNEIPNVDRKIQHQSIVDGLKIAAKVMEDEGLILCVEPLNVLVNHKGYYLSTSEEGFQIIDEVGSPNIKLLFDIYHQQITEGNLIANITANIDKIGHFHLADVPGRHEPGTGEINYRNVFKSIAGTNYQGFMGLEYWPIGSDDDSLRSLIEMTKDL